MVSTQQINELIGVKESYQASDKLMSILFDKEKREDLFRRSLDIFTDLEKDMFHIYFEEEHANKKQFAQDFTPTSVSEILAKIIKQEGSGTTHDIASGTGSLIISKWQEDRCKHSPFSYKPSWYFYQCEELSDRAVPFLLFNLMLRGMNATVIHGDSLSREVKQVYFIQNTHDDFMTFSDFNVMPHSKAVEQDFDIRKWLEDEIDHKENQVMPDHLGGVFEC